MTFILIIDKHILTTNRLDKGAFESQCIKIIPVQTLRVTRVENLIILITFIAQTFVKRIVEGHKVWASRLKT